MRRILATILCLALLGAACGDDEPVTETTPGGESTNLDEIEVTGDEGEEPTLTFDEPFEVEETERQVITEGDGPVVAENAVVDFHFVIVNGRDGEVVTSSYEGDPASLTWTEGSVSVPGIYDGLDGLAAGSRVLVAIAPEDGAGADEASGLEEDDTVLFLADILDVRVPLTRAEGEPVPPVDGLPTVELGENGAPTITVPDDEPPTELVVQPLIEGTGPVVEAGQTITAHYTGVLWDDGTEFDSSWASGTPVPFQVGTGAVIAGWDEGLVGQTVGSQILLVVPPAKGYPEGTEDGSITSTDTLVFVVDILDAS